MKPERMEDYMSDLISRQAAIDKINERQRKLIYCLGFENDLVKIMDIAKSIVTAMPSAQPEIIHCGDCKYKDDGIDEDGVPFLKCLNGRSYGGTRINDYCSWADRRTDE